MAGDPPYQNNLLSLPPPEERGTLLAFRFDTCGKPTVIAEFDSEIEKLAIIQYAGAVLRRFNFEFEQQAEEALRSAV